MYVHISYDIQKKKDYIYLYITGYGYEVGRNSVVSKVNLYGSEGPGIESR